MPNNWGKKMKLITGIIAMALLSGCASSSSIVVGKTRPAIAVTDVKLYLRAPEKYEEIAMLEASSKASFTVTDQGKTDKMLERMKTEAARLGANGVLLTSTGTNKEAGAVFIPFATGGGVMAPAGSEHKAGAGMAIFVTQE